MAQTQQMTKMHDKSSHNPQLRPLGNRVFVRRLEMEEKLKGGILSTRYSQEKTGTGGSDCDRHRQKRQKWRLDTHPSQSGRCDSDGKILRSRSHVERSRFVILRADDIIAIVEK